MSEITHMAISGISSIFFLQGFATPKPLKYQGAKNRCKNLGFCDNYLEKAERIKLKPAMAKSPATTPSIQLRKRLYPVMKPDKENARA